MAKTKKTETDVEKPKKTTSKKKTTAKTTAAKTEKKSEIEPEIKKKESFWSKLSTAMRIVIIGVLFLALATAAILLIFKRVQMPDNSMEATLKKGEKIVYNRLSTPQQGDIVVFRNPETDTVVIGHPEKNYYKMSRMYGANWISKAELKYQKPNKRNINVSRCVAGPNELVEIKDNKVFVNKKQISEPENIKKLYFVVKEGIINAYALDSIGLTKSDIEGETDNVQDYIDIYKQKNTQNGNTAFYSFTEKNAEDFAKFSVVKHIEQANLQAGHFERIVFPYAEMGKKSWNESNFGPLRIPAKGMKLKLSAYTVQLYRRAIEAYEGNTIEIKPDGFYINGKQTDSYVFKQDYWFVMGDNRATKNDSRFFGLIPENHILGTAAF